MHPTNLVLFNPQIYLWKKFILTVMKNNLFVTRVFFESNALNALLKLR